MKRWAESIKREESSIVNWSYLCFRFSNNSQSSSEKAIIIHCQLMSLSETNVLLVLPCHCMRYVYVSVLAVFSARIVCIIVVYPISVSCHTSFDVKSFFCFSSIGHKSFPVFFLSLFLCHYIMFCCLAS